MSRSTMMLVPAVFLALAACATGAVAGDVPADDGSTRAVADFKSCAKPMYPKDALDNKREGTVTISYLVGTDGKTQDSRVATSSGHADLDESARWAISKCRFTPATKNGKAFTDWVDVKYVWTLH